MAKIRIKNLGKIVSWLMRGIGATLRFEVEDRTGAFDTQRPGWIWAFWHNRMFVIPYVHEQWFAHIPGAILSSPSGDGQIIADACAQFGFEAARGSSSKPQKGLSALIMLSEKVKEGRDVGITPDGPRGPLYQIQPGIIKLAQLTGGTIVPVRVLYSRALRFKTWDQFMLPLPFSTVKVIFEPVMTVPRRMTEEEFEGYRASLEQTLVKEA
ncbi:lysophospholipid acyltransferase family protein [Brevifollis gellanilyticus]|uniref:Lipoprotein n=1 Tax=Brevifollis gellanilyticus TaxID=748831 RepID=A0A512MA22_9BACT|nr:lysophospholipid acyltransferase family protein [Brevifollis gellanilyticus]GEP43588.1 lipoprotein [Brevifollis gellanilyticus]